MEYQSEFMRAIELMRKAMEDKMHGNIVFSFKAGKPMGASVNENIKFDVDDIRETS